MPPSGVSIDDYVSSLHIGGFVIVLVCALHSDVAFSDMIVGKD
jgi:hypothetical protein